MDTGFIVHIKSDIYAGDIETRFDASNYEVDRPPPIVKKKKVIRVMKIEWKNIEQVFYIETKDV